MDKPDHPDWLARYFTGCPDCGPGDHSLGTVHTPQCLTARFHDTATTLF